MDFVDDDAQEMLTFTAVSGDSSKVEVVSWKTVDNSAGNPLTVSVVLRGIASTWAADGAPDDDEDDDPDHIPVMVTITAMDRGGEMVEDTVAVTVDGAPEPKGTMPNRTVKLSDRDGQGNIILITNVTSFFTDPDPVSRRERHVLGRDHRESC